MNGKVLLIGGTSDSAAIAAMLAAFNIRFVVTVTTITARSLYSSTVAIVVERMDRSRMQFFCQQNQIQAVVDASHPYAVEVSRQAIAICTQLNLPYLRYERVNYQASAVAQTDSFLMKLNSFDQLLAGDYLTKQRVFLTVGCQILPRFKSWQNRATLYARILPKIASLETAIAAGFTGDRLIAIRPPISVATETALWQQWKISLVVTKASGKAGGEDIKHQVAKDLGIPLIVIARPQITYPQQTSEIKDVLAFCQAI
ncbi:MAG TPA: cobalt-precorrin-6A reductase [Coleofasciculaceae cyanobacterium]|jgi:precorrin-6A/cobalt-precorrin-6A reductase